MSGAGGERSPRGARSGMVRWMMVVALVATAAVTAHEVTPVRAVDDPSTPCDDFIVTNSDGRSSSPRPQTVVQVESSGTCALEQEIIAQIAAERGLALTPHV